MIAPRADSPQPQEEPPVPRGRTKKMLRDIPDMMSSRTRGLASEPKMPVRRPKVAPRRPLDSSERTRDLRNPDTISARMKVLSRKILKILAEKGEVPELKEMRSELRGLREELKILTEK